MNLTNYHAKYFAYELTKQNSSDSMQKLASTLVDAQVDLNPHQVEAALFAFRSPLSKGAILADEVGLGKTIEAGLVISQKWAEQKRKILIVTPANLRKQWSQELQDKFFLSSVILEAKSFNECIKKGNLNPFQQAEIIICSYQFVKTKDVHVKSIAWDLAVVDEAHRLRNVYKSGNKIAKAIKNALNDAPKILLTATPLQNSLMELYGLVSIIDDYTFGDEKSFRSQYNRISSTADAEAFAELKERLKPICQRTMRQQVLEYIQYTKRIALVEEFYPSEAEQQLYDLVSEYLQTDNLYALPASQRKLMTLILRKLLGSSTFAISGTLERLGNKLKQTLVENNAISTDESIAEDFELYDELKDEWEDEDTEGGEKEKKSYTAADIENIKNEMEALKAFETLAKSILINSKGEKLFTALERGFKEMHRLNAPRKVIIFTESTRTQMYLRDILEAKDYKGEVVLFNGTNNDAKSREIYANWVKKHKDTDKITGSRSADMRAALVDYFRDEATIMIATEAAAEGINLQFCSMIINYDMPWNPQRIEQRIGRCHRYGQKHDVVVINFLNKANAADVRVYQLLEEKFKLFDNVFGASDDVLGNIDNGLDFEKRIADIYQNCRTTHQINTAFDELQSEYKDDISDAMKKTRQSLLTHFDEEVHEKLRINMQESKAYLSKYETWLWQITKFCLDGFAEFSTDEHSFSLLKNPFSEAQIFAGPYRIGKNVGNANVYRIGHPLAQRIIEKCKSAKLPNYELVFDYSNTVKNIAVLEPLVGQSGYLWGNLLSVTSFELEEIVQLSAITEGGVSLAKEQAERLFSLPASVNEHIHEVPLPIFKQLNNDMEIKRRTILSDIGQRNAVYFENELEKLDLWGDDRRNSLRVNLKDLDDEIKEIKKQSKNAPNVPEKLKLERQRRKLENDRDVAWKEYDNAAKEIDRNKDLLIDKVEQRLNHSLTEESLFLIKWKII